MTQTNEFMLMVGDIVKKWRIELKDSSHSFHRKYLIEKMKEELLLMKETWEALHGTSPDVPTFEEIVKQIN